MFFEDLWNSIDNDTSTELLLDSLRITNFNRFNYNLSTRLGFIHSVGKYREVLDLLRESIGISELCRDITVGISSSGMLWNDINIFWSQFYEYGRGKTDVKFIKCITASSLGKDNKEMLSNAFKDIFPKFFLDFKVEKEIVAGSVIEIGNYRFDSSYKKYFNKLEQEFINILNGEFDE